jgi:hypothetical protein
VDVAVAGLAFDFSLDGAGAEKLDEKRELSGCQASAATSKPEPQPGRRMRQGFSAPVAKRLSQNSFVGPAMVALKSYILCAP